MMLSILKVWFLIGFVGVFADDPIIELPDGKIQGRIATTPKGANYYAFEKIPYAEPPVGPLRFKAPKPPQKWTTTLETTHLDVICISTITNGDNESEDCLYINVFTPELPPTTNDPLPVLFFVFGGGFITGDSIGWRPDFLIDQNVIVVTFNYRVGPFGFLSTGDDVIPGNQGLKDQKLALEWTFKNVALFGGDKNRITINGQSAGSASVAYQLLNMENSGLFQAAILESGSFLSPWAYQRRAKEIAFVTAGFIDEKFATSRNTSELGEFLMNVDVKQLDRASEMFHDHETAEDIELQKGFFWGPVIEAKNPEAFITKPMYQLLKAGAIIQVPILMGIDSEESIFDQSDEGKLRRYMASYDRHLDWLVPLDMKIADESDQIEMGRKIRDIYTGGKNFVYHLGDGVRYFSDNAFTRSMIKHAEMQSKDTNIYFYQFSYDGINIGYNTHYEGCEWVGHGEEVNYLWNFGNDWPTMPASDQLTQNRLLKLWTDFVKYNNPTPVRDELLNNVIWPNVDVSKGEFQYLDIGIDVVVKSNPKNATFGPWVDLYNSLGYDDFDSY